MFLCVENGTPGSLLQQLRAAVHCMKVGLFGIFGLLFLPRAFGIDCLEPDSRLTSPDTNWEVFVVKYGDDKDYAAEFYISPHGSSERVLLAENGRHFGAEWSPDSKVLLVYDNMGSGSSDTIIFRRTPEGWRKIYQTLGGFHVIWRLDEWLPGSVRLRSYAGGSSPDEAPPTVTIPLDDTKR